MFEMTAITDMSVAVAVVLGGAGLGYALAACLVLLSKALARRQAAGAAQQLIAHSAGAAAVFLSLLGAYLGWQIAFAGIVDVPVGIAFRILLVITGAYFLVRLVYGASAYIETRLGIDRPDNLDARRRYTQLRVLRRVLVSIIAVVGFIVALLYLPGARELGTGLLASAGIAGLVIGLAAQRALGNLFAGFQIAFTQPIRLDDVVVVEGEWGRIEEITLTYVVIEIWDQRRLILPIAYFLEHPFTNWTRESAAILGTVFLYVDYEVDIEALRAELKRLVEASADWDGRVCGLAVTDCKENALELRALVSASDGGAAWNLRCAVREGLVGYLKRMHPESLPRLRAEIIRPETPNTGR